MSISLYFDISVLLGEWGHYRQVSLLCGLIHHSVTYNTEITVAESESDIRITNYLQQSNGQESMLTLNVRGPS